MIMENSPIPNTISRKFLLKTRFVPKFLPPLKRKRPKLSMYRELVLINPLCKFYFKHDHARSALKVLTIISILAVTCRIINRMYQLFILISRTNENIFNEYSNRRLASISLDLAVYCALIDCLTNDPIQFAIKFDTFCPAIEYRPILEW